MPIGAGRSAGNYTEVAEAFDPQVGFLARGGFRKPDRLRAAAAIRPKSWLGIHELRPHVSYRGFWDFDDSFQQTGFLHVDNHWEWKQRLRGPHRRQLHPGRGRRSPSRSPKGSMVPAGTYDHEEAQHRLLHQPGRARLQFELRTTLGGFFGGDRVSLTPSVRYRLGERLTGQVQWIHNDIDLPGGDFETNLGRTRLSYSFTPKIFVEALVQYNDRIDDWSTNLRFGWLQRAGAGFYVVYNETRDIGSAGTGVPERSLIIKLSRLVDVFR